MGPNGWPFANVDPFPAADEDHLYQSEHVKDLYLKVDPDYTGRFAYPLLSAQSDGQPIYTFSFFRFTVPVLWDKKLNTIVNNESSEIIRMFNTAFNEFLPADKAAFDYYPEKLRSQIDALNEWIYPGINSLFHSYPSVLIFLNYSLQMVSIGRASPPPKKHIRKLLLKCSMRSTNSRKFLMAKTTS